MSFPAYPNYKESGFKWLGPIPSHWQTVQSRRLFRARRESANKDDVMLTASQKYGMLPQTEFVAKEGRRVVEVIQGKDSLIHVEPDDFVISMRSFQGGLEWCRYTGSTSFHYVPVTPIKSVVPSYFAHLFKSIPYISALRSTTNLIRDGQEIRYSNFVQVTLPLAPEDEQLAISNFLDHETAKIDALIAEQQRLIELLQEKRQAVISHAVTKGLNPDAPMKDSGVEWLGEVPEHWKILELKHLKKGGTSITYGIVQAGPHIEDGIPYIRTSDMAGDRLMVESCQRTSIAIDEAYARSRVFEGDLVVAIRATVGKVLEVPVELDGANLTQGTAKFSPGSTVSARFVKYSFGADYCQAQIMFSAKGATFLEITLDVLRRLRLAIPPLAEQKEIVNYLEGATGRMGYLLASAQQTIYLLQERRSALISAAVTGQIDVRGLVPEVAAA